MGGPRWLTSQRVTGVKRKFVAPLALWGPMIEWLRSLQWGPLVAWRLPPLAFKAAQRRSTWIELYLAFVLHTGTQIGADQISVFRIAFRRVHARAKILDAAGPVCFKRAFEPATCVSSLIAVAGVHAAGIQRRPAWSDLTNARLAQLAVSYTHLTLPTICSV